MKKILVWLSWWVDSAVSAYLLQKEWYDVTAWFMINYMADDNSCPTKQDIQEAKKVAEYLWINFFTFDYQKEYWNKIVEYIFEWYKQGFTPNPDILCNTEIKFKLFLQEALNLWFDWIATWHYANILEIENNKKQKKYKLLKWKDAIKDQSYFLAGLEQWQLSKAIFPIWNLQKSQVRKFAKDIWLPNANRKDSQWLCFIWKVDMKDFLKKKLPVQKWITLDTNGNKIWQHDWAWFFTIWQRRWIWVSWQNPLYIVNKDINNNIITVWEEKDLNLFSKELLVDNCHYLSDKLNFPQKWFWRIRHWQTLQKCIIYDLWKNKIKVIFEKEQRAIASGQTFAFYQWDELVFSAIIV